MEGMCDIHPSLDQRLQPMKIIPATDRWEGQNKGLKASVSNPGVDIISEGAIRLMGTSNITSTLYGVLVELREYYN